MPPTARVALAGSPFYAQVGDLVRKARQECGLTQDALAEAVKLTRTSIANIEGGRQRLLLHTFVALARVLNKEPATLLPEGEVPDPLPDADADPGCALEPGPDDRRCG